MVDVLFFHPSLVVHAMLKYNSRIGNQKTKQTRGDAASEDKKKFILSKKNTRLLSRARRRDKRHADKKELVQSSKTVRKTEQCTKLRIKISLNTSPAKETLRNYSGSNMCHTARIGVVATRIVRAHGDYQCLSCKANISGNASRHSFSCHRHRFFFSLTGRLFCYQMML